MLSPVAALTIAVKQGGESVPGHAMIDLKNSGRHETPPFRFIRDSNSSGTIEVRALPPGRYEVSVSTGPVRSVERLGETSGRYEERMIDLVAGHPAHLELDLPQGALVRVSAVWEADLPVETVRYDWLTGHHEVQFGAEMGALAAEDADLRHRAVLFGGVHLHETLEIVHMDAGEYTVCAEAERQGETLAHACTFVTVAAPGETKDLELHLNAP